MRSSRRMDLFREFFSLVKRLEESCINYAVVGGVALAFHSIPRLTKDIDILGTGEDLEKYYQVLEAAGFRMNAKPWKFANTDLTLHRFMKPSETDPEAYTVIDLLIGDGKEHRAIINRALEDKSAAGKVMIAQKNDLIAMKRVRGSKQDLADIEALSSE